MPSRKSTARVSLNKGRCTSRGLLDLRRQLSLHSSTCPSTCQASDRPPGAQNRTFPRQRGQHGPRRRSRRSPTCLPVGLGERSRTASSRSCSDSLAFPRRGSPSRPRPSLRSGRCRSSSSSAGPWASSGRTGASARRPERQKTKRAVPNRGLLLRSCVLTAASWGWRKVSQTSRCSSVLTGSWLSCFTQTKTPATKRQRASSERSPMRTKTCSRLWHKPSDFASSMARLWCRDENAGDE
mmetsp:Transcript_92612/g.299502  ORF Transcript_92612/g.299502 Transcript_92612/m.299502 type:complete len:239 (-) Transcript_92612:640-1356(-)